MIWKKDIKSNIKFFADDTMLFSIVKDPNISAIDLNHDLDVINKWAHQWKLEFNPDPLKQASEVLFSCKKKTVNHPPLFFNGTIVNRVDNQKHLGLTLQSNLSFEKHLTEKVKNAKKNIGIIKHLSKFLPLKTLDQMYKALTRSNLDYCDVIYHIPSKQDQRGEVLNHLMAMVEQVQYLAALAITGSWRGSSRSKLYDELGWETLSDRRFSRRIMHFHKIVNNKTPAYLKNKLPLPRRALYRFHNDKTFQAIRSNSDRYMNSFYPNAVKLWNIVILDFTEMPSFNILKQHFLSLFRPEKKSIFNIFNPTGIRNLFYLRVGLSPLRGHKHRHGFIDTPSATCICKDGFEDTSHFLFVCSFYINQRKTLRDTVSRILQKYNLINLVDQSHVYLYGNKSIAFADNKEIILSTIKFINDTDRFSP